MSATAGTETGYQVGGALVGDRRAGVGARYLRWARAGTAVLALGLALVSQRIVENARQAGEQAPPLASWLLFALAGLLLVAAAWPPPRQPAAPPTLFLATLRRLPRPWLFYAPLGLAILCNLAAVPLFVQLNSVLDPAAPAQAWPINTGSWLLWIASLLLYGLAWVAWERMAPPPAGVEVEPPGGVLPRRVEWIAMAGLFVVALVLRMANLDNVPPGLWFDEAQDGTIARRLVSPGAAHVTFIGDIFTQKGMLDLYFAGWVIKPFGDHVWAVRFVPALAGALCVPLLYMLGARLFGWRVGLAAAALTAVSAWHITFSRFAAGGLMFTVMLDVAAYLCLVQALRTGRLGYFAAGGTILGLGLHIYYPAKFAFVVLLAVLLHRLIGERARLVTAVRAGVPAFGLAVAMGFMPVALFAAQHWNVYNSRVNTVSIFNQGGQDPMAGLLESLRRHLLMFNWIGDHNGRHNLSGEPMLDWLTAALLFGGLAACLLRFWRWQYFFALFWFATAMLGGILSLLFEAPQGARTVENGVVTALLAGIFLGEAWQAIGRALAPETPRPRKPPGSRPAMGTLLSRRGPSQPAPAAMPPQTTAEGGIASTLLVRMPRPGNVAPDPVRPAPDPPGAAWPAGERAAPRRLALAAAVSAAGILLVVVVVAGITIPRYFAGQATDRKTWEDMNSTQARAARVLAAHGRSADVYAGQYFQGLNHARFLAPGVVEQKWSGMHMLPLDGKGRDAVLLLDRTEAQDLAAIARIYPNSTFEPLLPPGDSRPLMWTITIPAADLYAPRGVRASIARGDQPPEERSLTAMEIEGEGYESLRLEATLKITEFGDYGFQWESTAGGPAQIVVDGKPVEPGHYVPLGVGLHSLAVSATRADAGAGLAAGEAGRLLWNTAAGAPEPIPADALYDPRKIRPRGLTGVYRRERSLDGPAELIRVDPAISFVYHQPTLPFIFNVEWSGRIYIPESGEYTFGTSQSEWSELMIGGIEVLKNRQGGYKEVTLQMEQGLHPVRLRYQQAASWSSMLLYWTPPGRERSVIPSAFLWPEMAAYPDPGAGGEWPSPAESDGSMPPADRLRLASPLPTPAPSPVRTATAAPARPEALATRQTDTAPLVEPELVAEVSLRAESGQAAVEPRDVAVDGKGNFYVAANGDGVIRKYDPSGGLLTEWGNTGGQKVFEELFGIAIGPGDILYALDSAANTILTFDAEGRSRGEPLDARSYNPRGLSVTPGGDLLVVDTGGGRVLRLDPRGDVLSEIGRHGSAPGEFIEPTDAVANEQGDIFVLDTGNARVQRFDRAGTYLAAWAVDRAPTARDSGHIALDARGRLLVTSPLAGTVTLYSPEGEPLAHWRETDRAPAGVFADAADHVYVTYPGAGVVRKYRLPQP